MATEAKKTRKARTPAPANETPKQRFVRLAEQRTGKALNIINGLGKLTGRNYESTHEQRDKITAALLTAVKTLEAKFKGEVQTAAGFKL